MEVFSNTYGNAPSHTHEHANGSSFVSCCVAHCPAWPLMRITLVKSTFLTRLFYRALVKGFVEYVTASVSLFGCDIKLEKQSFCVIERSLYNRLVNTKKKKPTVAVMKTEQHHVAHLTHTVWMIQNNTVPHNQISLVVYRFSLNTIYRRIMESVSF